MLEMGSGVEYVRISKEELEGLYEEIRRLEENEAGVAGVYRDLFEVIHEQQETIIILLQDKQIGAELRQQIMDTATRTTKKIAELRAKLGETAPEEVVEKARLSYGAMLIAQERQRQVEGEGWTAEHDDKHPDNALAYAALCYLVPDVPDLAMTWWPWDLEWFKPKDRISNFVRAGALIAAEIDRLYRARNKESDHGH